MKVIMNANGFPERNTDGTPKVEWNGSNIRFGEAGYTFDEALKHMGDGHREVYLGRNATLRREDIQYIEPKLFAPILANLEDATSWATSSTWTPRPSSISTTSGRT